MFSLFTMGITYNILKFKKSINLYQLNFNQTKTLLFYSNVLYVTDVLYVADFITNTDVTSLYISYISINIYLKFFVHLSLFLVGI